MSSVIIRGGQRLHNVHSARACRGRHCPIHRVSDHEMRQWDQVFMEGVMWRVNPLTKLIYLDPDQVNAVKCRECGDVVASLHRHDFRSCACGLTSIDGGFDYRRILIGKR